MPKKRFAEILMTHNFRTSSTGLPNIFSAGTLVFGGISATFFRRRLRNRRARHRRRCAARSPSYIIITFSSRVIGAPAKAYTRTRRARLEREFNNYARKGRGGDGGGRAERKGRRADERIRMPSAAAELCGIALYMIYDRVIVRPFDNARAIHRIHRCFT